jgi:uncharacterized protein with PQ loop repeat
MEFVTQDGYQYVGLLLAGTSLLPQIRMSWQINDMTSISTASLSMMWMSSLIWGFYMYEKEIWYYAVATYFVGAQALLLLFYKFRLYIDRYNEHMAKFDSAPPPIVATIEQNSV